MDRFFIIKNCDRCGGTLEGGRTMSMFNMDCICMKCKMKERENKNYGFATDQEREAVLSGNYNYKGIGYIK